MKFCPVTTFRAAILAMLCFFGCDSSVKQNAAEIEHLRAELENLKYLGDHVDVLEQEVKALKVKVGSSSDQESPIVPTILRTTGNQIDDPFLGPKDADVLVMEFSDYQCVPCRRFFWDVFPSLKSEFIETGKIKFMYRDFPLKTNKHARGAAQLANCAGEQGYYWQMFEILYNNPEEVDSGDFYDLGKKLPEAKQEDLHTCMEKTAYTKEIDGDIADGTELGARGAPGFFIGKKSKDGDSYSGVFVRGAQPFAVMENEIQKVLGD